jgi:hypothetical protein
VRLSLAAAALSFALLALPAFGQSPVFRQRIDRMVAEVLVERGDGGLTVQVDCFAQEGTLRDGGTWPLKVVRAGPIVGTNANQALQACAVELQTANQMDGGTQ